VFDVYGTLINTQGIVTDLHDLIGQKAEDFSRTWRDKQLEYSFRRGLMQCYAPFSICTSDALDYACLFHKVELSIQQKNRLLQSYKQLPLFDEVKPALEKLKEKHCRLFAFSNGTFDAVATLLAHSGIKDYFDGVVSVDDVKSFKPNPAVYSHMLRETGAKVDNAWLVSSNAFDVIGAMSAGVSAAWVKRSNDAILDPWGIEPSLTISSLLELHPVFSGDESVFQ
jgi:2-haloacid dehalogenase